MGGSGASRQTDRGENPGPLDYADRPCYGELVAILAAGTIKVAIAVVFSVSVARLFTAAVALCFLIYVAWRATRTTGVLRVWGMRRDNFVEAVRLNLAFGLVAAVVLLGFGLLTGSLGLPGTVWLILILYPVPATMQQFALQNMLARNLAGLFSHPLIISLVCGLLFGMSHYPRTSLVWLTVPAGFAFTVIYQKVPNLWAVGLVHGLLGTIAVYTVLREDPGAKFFELLLG